MLEAATTALQRGCGLELHLVQANNRSLASCVVHYCAPKNRTLRLCAGCLLGVQLRGSLQYCLFVSITADNLAHNFYCVPRRNS